MWRYVAVLFVVAALAFAASGCGKKTPPEGTGVAGPPPAPPPTTVATAITYQCPVHENVTSDTPGRCTEEGCDEFLVGVAPEGQEVEYYCDMLDMHDEVVLSDTAGKCPKCSMFMKARIKGSEGGEGTDEDGPEDDEEE